MTLPQALGEYLRTEADETIALVGTRSFWCYETQSPTKPFVTFRQAGWRPMADALDRANALGECTIEAVCVADSQTAAWAVADAVVLNLNNYNGLMPSTGTIWVNSCRVTDKQDLLSEENFAAGNFAVSLSFLIRA